FYADSPAAANAALDGLVFTPAADWNGFTYINVSVRDRSLMYPMDTYGYVQVTVTPVNDAPTAVNDSYERYEDYPLTAYGLGVLGTDTDPEYNPLTAQLVSGPSHGSVVLNPNGSFTYTPVLNYNGPDSFTYRASDGKLLSNVATVSLSILPQD